MERCCGTCIWSEPVKPETKHGVKTGPKRVDCDWLTYHKTPDCISPHVSFMYEDQGTTCPCWEPKP